jgi:hypothetical protein
MKLATLFATRRKPRTPRPVRRPDPTASFSARDWADLPTFHPEVDNYR